MKKGTKIALIVAVACLVVGLPLFAVPVARLTAQPLSPVTDLRQEGERLDPSATTDGQTEEAPNNSGLTAHVWQPERSFTGIRVEVVNPHVTVLPAEDGITRVEYTQDSRYPITLQQEGDTLRVTQKDYWTMGLLDLLTRPQIRIYLAEQTYNALSVDVTSGSVEVAAGLTFGTISLETTSGSITCHADARGELELDSTSGSVAVENITAASLSAETTSGSITITATTVERELELDSTSGMTTFAPGCTVCMGGQSVATKSSACRSRRLIPRNWSTPWVGFSTGTPARISMASTAAAR